eukprot:ctg_3135.g608
MGGKVQAAHPVGGGGQRGGAGAAAVHRQGGQPAERAVRGRARRGQDHGGAGAGQRHARAGAGTRGGAGTERVGRPRYRRGAQHHQDVRTEAGESAGWPAQADHTGRGGLHDVVSATGAATDDGDLLQHHTVRAGGQHVQQDHRADPEPLCGDPVPPVERARSGSAAAAGVRPRARAVRCCRSGDGHLSRVRHGVGGERVASMRHAAARGPQAFSGGVRAATAGCRRHGTADAVAQRVCAHRHRGHAVPHRQAARHGGGGR